MIDILLDIPSYLEKVTRDTALFPAVTPKSRAHYYAVREGTIRLLEKLDLGQKTWKSDFTHAFRQISPKGSPLAKDEETESSSGEETPFKTVFYFTDMWPAYELCTYNTAVILLVSLYHEFSEKLNEQSTPPFFISPVQEYGRQICRCAEYLLLDIHGSRGWINFTFSATIAYCAMDEDSVEAKWLYTVCKRNSRSKGFGFGEFALDRVTPFSEWMRSRQERRRATTSAEQAPLGIRSRGEQNVGRLHGIWSTHTPAGLPPRAPPELVSNVRTDAEP